MNVFGFLLRLFSYLFNLILCLFLLGVGLVALSSHTTPHLGMLPFSDQDILTGVFALAIIGLIATLLAMTGIFRYLFPVWTLIVFWLLIRGFFLSPYTFPNADAFYGALWLTFGGLGALFGGLWTLRRRVRRI